MSKELMDNKKVGDMNTLDMMNELIDAAQKKRDDLEHNILLGEVNLAQLRDRIVKEKNDFDIWKRLEKDKFQNELNVRFMKVSEKEHATQVNLDTANRMLSDSREKMRQFVTLEQDKKNVDNDRVEVHKLKVQAQEMMDQANSKLSKVQNTINDLAFREQEIKKLDEKNQSIRVEIVHREESIDRKLKEIELQTKNLNDLKKIVDPKVKELNEIKSDIENTKKEILEKERAILKIKDENNAISKALEEKESKLVKLQKDLNSQQEDIKRQKLLLSSKHAG